MSFQIKIEMIQIREDECSLFSLEGLAIALQCIGRKETEVFIFDMEYLGVSAFDWGPCGNSEARNRLYNCMNK